MSLLLKLFLVLSTHIVLILAGTYCKIPDISFMSRLKVHGKFTCFAVNLNLSWVLTAGRCCSSENLKDYTLMAGEREKQKFSVRERRLHPKYSKNSIVNDVCILRLDDDFKLTEEVSLVNTDVLTCKSSRIVVSLLPARNKLFCEKIHIVECTDRQKGIQCGMTEYIDYFCSNAHSMITICTGTNIFSGFVFEIKCTDDFLLIRETPYTFVFYYPLEQLDELGEIFVNKPNTTLRNCKNLILIFITLILYLYRIN